MLVDMDHIEEPIGPEGCSPTHLSIERRRLQRAKCVSMDTSSLSKTSASSLSNKLQEAFFTGTVFTIIRDSASSSVEVAASPEELGNANATTKRTLHDLYSGADLVQEERLDSIVSVSDQPCHGDTLFTFDGHEMLHHSAAEPALTESPLPARIQRQARTPDYNRISCAHLQ